MKRLVAVLVGNFVIMIIASSNKTAASEELTYIKLKMNNYALLLVSLCALHRDSVVE